MNKTCSAQHLILPRKIRLYTFVLVLLWIVPMVFSAGAESKYLSIRELRETTPATWSENLRGGKKIECTVDADIVLPEVDRFPVLTVTYQGKIPGIEETGYYIDDNDKYEYMVKTMSDSEYTKAYKKKFKSSIASIKEYYEDSMTVEQIQDADLRAREIIRRVWDLDGTELERFSAVKSTDGKNYQEMTVFFCPVYNGIPYLQCPGSNYVIKDLARRPYNMTYAFWEDNMEYEGSLTCIPRLTGEYLPDVPLLPFEKIQEILRRHIAEGYVQRIYELRLGYICCNDPDRPGENFFLTPAWIVCGEINSYPNIPFYPNDSPIFRYDTPLAVNAQTGEIIDVNSQKKETFDAHILTWEDVQ